MRPAYGGAEETIGRALGGRPHDVVLATAKRYDPGKFRSGEPGDHGLSRHQIVAAIDGSPRRLQADYVDGYYAHQPDFQSLRSTRRFVRSTIWCEPAVVDRAGAWCYACPDK